MGRSGFFTGAALFTAPIRVLIFAALLSGRRIGPRQAVAVALGFAGVLAMLRPDPASLSAVAPMPAAAGAFYGLSNLLAWEFFAEEPVGALLAAFVGGLAIASALALLLLAAVEPPREWIEAAPLLVTGWRMPGPGMLLWMLAQAAGAVVAVDMVARGYQCGETASLAVFEYVHRLSAGFWTWGLRGEALGPWDVLGIAMIVASGAIVALAPRRAPPRAPHPLARP